MFTGFFDTCDQVINEYGVKKTQLFHYIKQQVKISNNIYRYIYVNMQKQ